MMRDRNWCDQFYRRRFRAFVIVEGCGQVALYGKELVVPLHGIHGPIPLRLEACVALLNECGLLGVLAILAFGNQHAVFGILTVLALGSIDAFSNILAVPDLGVFALLVITWHDTVIIASCQ